MADRAIPYQGKHPRVAKNDGIVGAVFALALVFACFTLSSTSYLAWLYRLIEFEPGISSEAVTMVGGYSFQALGIGFMCALMYWRPRLGGHAPFIAVIAIHFACAAAAVLAKTPEALIALGFCMNFLSGIVCAFYLQRLSKWAPRNRRGLAFGGGYACSVATTWALSLTQGGSPLDSTQSIIACAVLSLVAIALVAASPTAPPTSAEHENNSTHPPAGSPHTAISDDASTQELAKSNRLNETAAHGTTGASLAVSKDSSNRSADILLLACITVTLMSLVKNVGFGFPSADLIEGVSLESSRLFYAAGLIIAGFIADTNRKHAALCCIAALVLPFGFIALASEPISGTILWAVDYLFFGFFSVYRVVLFCDLAEDTEQEHLAGFGLLFGRVGDALGTALCLALGSTLVALVAVSAVLFAATVFAFYHLLNQLHPTHVAAPKTEQERFEEFAIAYGISVREREVLRLVLAERTNAEVASELFITEGTVKYHVHNLFKKTGCANRRELMAKYNGNA